MFLVFPQFVDVPTPALTCLTPPLGHSPFRHPCLVGVCPAAVFSTVFSFDATLRLVPILRSFLPFFYAPWLKVFFLCWTKKSPLVLFFCIFFLSLDSLNVFFLVPGQQIAFFPLNDDFFFLAVLFRLLTMLLYPGATQFISFEDTF